MASALFVGVTGLEAHQRRLDVVANNIANVNTIGYRGSRILFQDLFAQTLRGGAAPSGGFGGSNPMQIGLGVTIASIDVNHGQGSLMTTGVSSDLAIQGQGFFVLTDADGRQAYTRDGSFTLNVDGELIEPGTGMRVQGFLANSSGEIPEDALPTDIVIPSGGEGIVRATEEVIMTGNLNSDAADGETVTRTLVVYDSLGTEREVTITFTKDGTGSSEWDWAAVYDNGTTTPTVGSGTITFDADGTLAGGSPLAISISAGDLGNPDSPPDTPFAFSIDMTSVTQLSEGIDASTGNANTSDVAVRSQDGFPRGVLESFSIGANGEITGVFTNGLTRTLGVVALANFANIAGLSRDGNNTFIETASSGLAQIGRPGTGGRGDVAGGVLENSNVDLGTEFSNLIITQRGYQANARTVTASDTILQETVNLVR